MNTLLKKNYSADNESNGGGSIAKQALLDGPLCDGTLHLDDTAKNKIIEVGDLLQQTIEPSERRTELIKLLLMFVQGRLLHPVFKTERAILASAIFAHGFGKILCASNIHYICDQLKKCSPTSKISSLISSLENVANDVNENFSAGVEWNKSAHDTLVNALHTLKEYYNEARGSDKQIYFICMKLMEQIEGEIATNSISSLNGHPEIYRSHYFDFIEGMSKSNPEQYNEYKTDYIKDIEDTYMKSLQELLKLGGNDGVTAVTLMSESFIGLTYKTIIDNVLNDETLHKNPAAKELHTFYQGHIELDGVEEIDSTDTHFEMVKHMLTQVEYWEKFLYICSNFISLRNDVHNALMKK